MKLKNHQIMTIENIHCSITSVGFWSDRAGEKLLIHIKLLLKRSYLFALHFTSSRGTNGWNVLFRFWCGYWLPLQIIGVSKNVGKFMTRLFFNGFTILCKNQQFLAVVTFTSLFKILQFLKV